MPTIPIAKPSVDKEEINEVVKTLKSGWLTSGPKVAAFEKALERYLGVKNVVTLSSCTAALHLVLKALKIGPGDEVITPSLTYISVGNVILTTGATPVFVEVDKETLIVDPKDVARKITKKTKVIVPVDYAGLPANIAALRKVIGKRNIIIVSDSATSFGATYKDKKVGTLADYTCFSFYATKSITTMEGGAITTNNVKVAENIRILSRLGITSDSWLRHSNKSRWFFEVIEPSLKYYMLDVQAAMGLAQLKKTDLFIRKREHIARRYFRELRDVSIIKSPYPTFPQEHAWNFYPILVKESVDRDIFLQRLNKHGIASSVYYIPVHMHPVFKKRTTKKLKLPLTEQVFSHLASLPLYPDMTKSQVDYIIKTVRLLDKKL